MQGKFDMKLGLTIAFLAVIGLGVFFLASFLNKPSSVALTAEFQPGTIRSGESSLLIIRVESQKDELSQPVVRIRTEKDGDKDYMQFGETEWKLYPMSYTGEVQIKKINVSATSPASESRFNAIVTLEEGGETVFTKKVPLTVQRE